MATRNSTALESSVSKRLRIKTGHDNSNSKRRLTPVVTEPITNRGFSLPAGWGVEEVFRSDGIRFDRYYYEPETGNKFRSLRDVERHLNGQEVIRMCRSKAHTAPPPVRNRPKMLKLEQEEENANLPKHLAIVPSESAETAQPDALPDGWVVEEMSFKDKFYCEPGTGRRFRSMVAVQKHLTELNENTPLSQLFKLHVNTTSSASWNKKTPTAEEPLFSKTPPKVKWVLASHKGDAWSPCIGDTLVSVSVKQQWRKRFMGETV